MSVKVGVIGGGSWGATLADLLAANGHEVVLWEYFPKTVESLRKTRRLAVLPASGAADPQTQMLVLRESVSLLYYPLWLVDYKVADRPYRVVVDANHGTVNSGTAPAANERLNPVLALRVAAMLAVAVFASWAASNWLLAWV